MHMTIILQQSMKNWENKSETKGASCHKLNGAKNIMLCSGFFFVCVVVGGGGVLFCFFFFFFFGGENKNV